jgi:predicted Zn-dependent protease
MRESLQELLSSGKVNPIVHFLMSNVQWQEKKRDLAAFHLRRAFEVNQTVAKQCINDFAWMMAQAENADLERAFLLAESVVAQAPESARVRNTYGTILLRLERYEDAVRELSLALNGVPDKKLVYRKLALAYEKLGMDELAQQHVRLGIEKVK